MSREAHVRICEDMGMRLYCATRFNTLITFSASRNLRGTNLSKRIERREHDRIGVRWPVTVLTNNRIIQAETRNVTVNGIFICSEEPLPLNDIFPIRISPPNYQIVEVSGKVIWSDRYAIDDQNIAYGSGICFVKVSNADRHLLNDLLLAHLG